MSNSFIKKISQNLIEAKRFNKKIIFTISSTSKQEKSAFTTPLRDYDNFCVFGCVLFEQSVLNQIAEILDGNVDLILVDAEKKIPLHIKDLKNKDSAHESNTIGDFETGNLSKICFNLIKISKILEYKPNDLTVNSAWMFISQKLNFLSGKKISILGFGNIGSKLSLKLVESGADVHVYSKDFYKTHMITQANNLVKPVGTIASITPHKNILSATFSSDVLIGATNGIPIINDEVIKSVNKDCLIIDLGKNNIFESSIMLAKNAGLEIWRADVTNSLESFISETLRFNATLSKEFGERKISDITMVSAGYFGFKGDLVVDSIRTPKKIYGVCDGNGSLMKKLTNTDKTNIKIIEEYFNI